MQRVRPATEIDPGTRRFQHVPGLLGDFLNRVANDHVARLDNAHIDLTLRWDRRADRDDRRRWRQPVTEQDRLFTVGTRGREHDVRTLDCSLRIVDRICVDTEIADDRSNEGVSPFRRWAEDRHLLEVPDGGKRPYMHAGL